MKKLGLAIILVVGLVAVFGFIGVSQAYTVKSGDTMWQIAQDVKISLFEFIRMNPQVKDPDLIYPGDVLSTQTEEGLFGATLPVAGTTYTLAGSGVTASATSVTLSSLTIPQTGYELQDSDFSDTFYITFEPGSTKRQEVASCTTVTQNADNSATLSGCTRGLLPFTPFTASSTYRFAHAGGTSVIFSDPPQLFNEFTSKLNNETVTGTWTFNNFPKASSTTAQPSTADQLATKFYVDEVGAGGFTCSNVSTTLGLQCTGSVPEKVGMFVSTTQGGAFGPDGRYYQKVRTSTGIEANSDGIEINTTTLVNLIATSTPSGNKIPIANASNTLHYDWLAGPKFGGSGVDGALSITAGNTTTIALGSEKVVVKNYTSVNIAGHLNFSGAATTGTLVVIKSQGDCTISGFVHATSTGAVGGASVTNGSTAAGLAGTTSTWYIAPGAGGAPPADGSAGGTGGIQVGFAYTYLDHVQNVYPTAYIGSGGSSGSANNGTSGKGGQGAGAIIFECAGTTQTLTGGTVNINGEAGGAGSGAANGGGGGGGGGGYFGFYYNGTLTGTPTVNLSGGTGGAGLDGGGACAGGGGGGGAFSAGSVGTTCTAASGNGGAGAAGVSVIRKNYWYF